MGEVQEFELEEIMSGREDSCLWVTLGFRSPARAEDVLHVVSATSYDQQDSDLGYDTIYLERYDQALSCYGGATSIRVLPDAVELDLTTDGQQSLGFTGALRFVNCDGVEDYREAIEVFSQMSATRCGRSVSVSGTRGAV